MVFDQFEMRIQRHPRGRNSSHFALGTNRITVLSCLIERKNYVRCRRIGNNVFWLLRVLFIPPFWFVFTLIFLFSYKAKLPSRTIVCGTLFIWMKCYMKKPYTVGEAIASRLKDRCSEGSRDRRRRGDVTKRLVGGRDNTQRLGSSDNKSWSSDVSIVMQDERI